MAAEQTQSRYRTALATRQTYISEKKTTDVARHTVADATSMSDDYSTDDRQRQRRIDLLRQQEQRRRGTRNRVETVATGVEIGAINRPVRLGKREQSRTRRQRRCVERSNDVACAADDDAQQLPRGNVVGAAFARMSEKKEQ